MLILIFFLSKLTKRTLQNGDEDEDYIVNGVSCPTNTSRGALIKFRAWEMHVDKVAHSFMKENKNG